jgi:hypothetical protein
LSVKEDRDQKFIDLKSRYEKTQRVLDIATRLLHEEEDKSKYEQQEYKDFHHKIVSILPRYDLYLNDFKI